MKKTKKQQNEKYSTKINFCSAIVMCCVTLCRCLCHCTLPPTVDGIRHPACWQQRRLLSELHLHSWKDNQPTGVFNLKYVCWTVNHSVQPLHAARTQGWTYFSPWQASTPPLSWDSRGSSRFWSHSHEIYCTALFFVFRLWLFMRWWNCFSWRLRPAAETLLEDCSVKCLGWSLNSSCQHQFTEQAGEAVVEENVIHAGRNRKLSWRSEGTAGGKERSNKGRREGEMNYWEVLRKSM